MYSHFATDVWITPFGLIFVVAIVAAWAYARRNAGLAAIDSSHVDLLLPITLIVGIAGGTVIAFFMPMDHMVAGEMMNHGIRVAISSDILPIGPMVGIYAAVTRKGMSGTVFGEEEALTVMEALRGYTLYGAWLSFEEDRKGSIEPGKLADTIASHLTLKIREKRLGCRRQGRLWSLVGDSAG